MAERNAENLQKMVLSLKHQTNLIKIDLDKLQIQMNDLHGIAGDEDNAQSRNAALKVPASYGGGSSFAARGAPYKKRGEMFYSPLEKKLAAYQRSAEMRRSGSRSRAGALGGASREGGAPINAFSFDNSLLREKVALLEANFEQLYGKFALREDDFETLKEIIEDNENEKFAFIERTGELIDELGRPEGGERRLTTPGKLAGGSFRGSRSDENTPDGKKLREITRANEQLLNELRKANDKYLNERFENNQLREKVSTLESTVDNCKRELQTHSPGPSQ